MYGFGIPKPPAFTEETNVDFRQLESNYVGEHNKWVVLEASGTPENPVVLSGFHNNTVFGEDLQKGYPTAVLIKGSYIVLEDCTFRGAYVRWDKKAHNICIRNCNFYNTGGVAASISSYTTEPDRSHHIIITQNKFDGIGDWQADFDEDFHCVAPGATHHMWITGNDFKRSSGNGVQATHQPRNGECHHLYIGFNRGEFLKQTLVGIKYAEDVIISKNHAIGLYPVGTSPSTHGDAFGCQYEHNRIWFLFNTIENCDIGINIGDSSGEELYIIGNHIIGCRPTDKGDWHPYNKYDPNARGYGMRIRNGDKILIAHNTIVDCMNGISISEKVRNKIREIEISNNLIHGPFDHLALSWVTNQETADIGKVHNNLMFSDDASASAKMRYQDYNVVNTLDYFSSLNNLENNIEGDPKINDVKSYRTSKDSIARDSGKELIEVWQRFEDLYGTKIDIDIRGKSRKKGIAPDIGAFESKVREN